MLIHTSKSRGLQRRHPGHLIEIDYSSPLARGLDVLIDSGSLSDLVHRQKCTVSGITRGLGSRGPSARTPGIDTTSGIFGTVNSTIGSGPMTEFCFVANANLVGASYQYVCGSYSATGVGMAIEYSSAGGTWGVFDNGTTLFANDVLQTGLEYFLVHTRDGTTHRLYRNGGLRNSVTAGNTTIPAIPFNQNTLASVGIAWSSHSNIYYSGRYRRPLDQAEVKDLYAYPWAWARKLPQIFAVTSGAGASAALIGSSETFAVGTLSPQVTVTLSGNSLTNAQGSLGPALATVLSGSVETFAAGTLDSALQLTLSGNAQTFAFGSLTVSSGYFASLTGLEQTFFSGNLTPEIELALSGNASSLAYGTVIVGAAYLVSLTGLAQNLSAGTLSPGVELTVNGQSQTVAFGLFSPGIQTELTGRSMTLTPGTLSIAGGSGGIGSLDPATIAAIAAAIWSDPRAPTIAKLLAIKDG